MWGLLLRPCYVRALRHDVSLLWFHTIFNSARSDLSVCYRSTRPQVDYCITCDFVLMLTPPRWGGPLSENSAACANNWINLTGFDTLFIFAFGVRFGVAVDLGLFHFTFIVRRLLLLEG